MILENRIAETYVSSSKADLSKSVYDTFIKAFRWSTDRLDPENGGIICFVSNGAWLDSNSLDGFRGYLEKEFSSIHVFNLRGNCRTSGELRQKEGGNVFGLGSRTPITITLLVNNPKNKTEKAKIHYYDIGDYHSRERKLEIIRGFSTVCNIKWNIITPNVHNDWINKRNSKFDEFIPIEPFKKFENNSQSFFSTYASAIVTSRDAWVFNFSEELLKNNMKKMINFYNEQRKLIENEHKKNKKINIDDYIDTNPQKISWTRALKKDVSNNVIHKFKEKEIINGLHRPFTKEHLYYDKPFIESPSLWSQFLINEHNENIIICITGKSNFTFSSLISKNITEYGFLNGMNGTTQCFPLYWYEKKEKVQKNLFDDSEDEYTRHDAISDFILEQVKTRYGGKVTKEDIFYYVYGILHSPDYRKTFANDLKKMLPRLPLVEKLANFWAFSEAGRKLADLHLNYEEQKKPKEVTVSGTENGIFMVEKMRFSTKKWGEGKWGEKKWGELKKGEIVYNSYITISNIPPKAYEYVVNGKSAIEWVMERYAVTTHKKSGIENNPNDWAKEHENPQYHDKRMNKKLLNYGRIIPQEGG
jgi:predicted helicase